MMEVEMDRTCNTLWDERKTYSAFVGKLEGKRPLGRCRHRWEDNTKWILEK
jgi:hypothetical protein